MGERGGSHAEMFIWGPKVGKMHHGLNVSGRYVRHGFLASVRRSEVGKCDLAHLDMGPLHSRISAAGCHHPGGGVPAPSGQHTATRSTSVFRPRCFVLFSQHLGLLGGHAVADFPTDLFGVPPGGIILDLYFCLTETEIQGNT